MATGTAATVPAPRQDPRQVVNTLRKTVNFNDTGISSGISFDNSIPQGAQITSVIVDIETAFNAVTTNVLTVGQNSTSYNDMVAAGDVDETVAGATSVPRGIGGSLARNGDITPFVKYTQTGTAATTGKAHITITYEGGWTS